MTIAPSRALSQGVWPVRFLTPSAHCAKHISIRHQPCCAGFGIALTPFLILFAALYAGFGVQSPYLPALLGDRGLRPEAIGMVLAAGTAVRLAAGPAAGRLADRLDAAKLVFAGCAAAAALMAL